MTNQLDNITLPLLHFLMLPWKPGNVTATDQNKAVSLISFQEVIG